MVAKNTDELEKQLKSVHPASFAEFITENKDSILDGDKHFSEFIKGILKRNGLSQQAVFLQADIPEGYGYKLLSEEKRTKQRDIILRLCYAGCLTLDETQKALRVYGMPELYAKKMRDAMLMVCFNERPGSILDVNMFLSKNKLEPLRSSGIQE